MDDTRGCETVRVALQGLGSGYFGEFNGYAFPTEHSDQVAGTRHKNIVHQGLSTIRYR